MKLKKLAQAKTADHEQYQADKPKAFMSCFFQQDQNKNFRFAVD